MAAPTQGAKYSGEFLSLGVGARALGLGGAFVGVADDVTASFWNPAGLAQLNRKELSLMHAETFGSFLNQDFVAFALPLREQNRMSTLAFSLQRLGGGGVKITDLEKDGVSGGAPVNVSFNISAVDAKGVDELLLQRRALITNLVNKAINNRGRSSLA